MAVSMKDIKKLRSRTSAGVLDCKKALAKKDGDIDAAVEYLREKGMSDASKRSGKVAAEGIVNIMINDQKSKGIIVEVNSETDFVAKNDKFKELVKQISEHIMQSKAQTLEELLEENWYKNDDKDVETIVKEARASIGENIKLRRFNIFETDGFLQGYTHLNGKIGVLVDINGDYNEDMADLTKNLAMHIAASSPEYINRDEVKEEDLKKEKKIYKEQMLNEGKPEHIIDNIVEGKIEKYYSQVCLLEQEYVRDEEITVKELLDKSDFDISINDFCRFELGEGIEKEKEDFAEEVKAELEQGK